MKTPITKNNIELFAHTNEELLEGRIPKGLVLEFHGLGGGTSMIKEQWPLAHICAKKDILYVVPYYGPWCWMNKNSVRYVDEVVDAIFDRFSLRMDTPILSSGYSMGGLAAIVYTRYAKRTPCGCAALSPVCDLPFHFTEREDIPRTIYGAFIGYNCSFEEALESASPVHLCRDLPDIPYFIFHGTADKEVRKDKHSDIFVAKMRELSRNVTYFEMPDIGHCDMTGEAKEKYHEYISGIAD